MKIDIGRKLYSIKEIYMIIYNGVRTAPYVSKSKRNNELDSDFIERIMLAVTEVNGCLICSYAHAKMALEAGLSSEEIQNMLSGIMTDTPTDQMQAVMFAQHYAESRGNPSKSAWDRIVESYGLNKAYGILGSIRIIMMGNALGIPWSSFINRAKGKADDRSTLIYELGVMTLGSLLIPIAMIQGLIAFVLKIELIGFQSN